MNWSKVKNVLIILMAAADIFLGISLAVQYRSNHYIDSDTIASTVELLQDGGIAVAPEVIPAKKSSAGVIIGKPGEGYHKSVALLLLGEEGISSQTPTGEIHSVSSAGYKASSAPVSESASAEFFSYDPFTLRWTSGGTELYNYAEAASDYLYNGGTAPFNVESEEITQPYNAERDIVRHFKKLGVTLSVISIVRDANTGRYAAVCRQSFSGLPSVQCEVTVIYDGNTVICFSGVLIFESCCEGQSSYRADSYDQVNILFMEKDYLDERRENADTELEHRVTYLNEEYCVNWSSDRSTYYLIPAWRVSYSDGSSRVRNAVTGSIFAL